MGLRDLEAARAVAEDAGARHIWQGIDELTAGIAAPIALGIGAALARISQHGWHGLRSFIADTITSVFVAVTIHWALAAYGVPATLGAAIIGASSFYSTVILDAVRRRIELEIATRNRIAGGI